MRGISSPVRVAQEGPDGCLGYLAGDSILFPPMSSFMADNVTETAIAGGVATHNDLHVAAVADENNNVLGTQYLSTTRQGYRQMLAWIDRNSRLNSPLSQPSDRLPFSLGRLGPRCAVYGGG